MGVPQGMQATLRALQSPGLVCCWEQEGVDLNRAEPRSEGAAKGMFLPVPDQFAKQQVTGLDTPCLGIGSSIARTSCRSVPCLHPHSLFISIMPGHRKPRCKHIVPVLRYWGMSKVLK